MWVRLSNIIIKNRLVLLIILGLITVFMGYQARTVTMSYELAKVVPMDDPDMIKFMEFKELFGGDGNMLALAIKDSSIFEVTNFRRFKYLSEELKKLKGVTQVLSLPVISKMVRNKAEKKFELIPIFETIPDDQDDLDSLLEFARNQKFYSGQLFNPDNGAVLILVGMDKQVLESQKRVFLTKDIQMLGEAFSEHTGITIHYAGLPFVRSIIAGKVKEEMTMFIIFSLTITGIIMWVFFKSKTAVIFPMIIIGVVVVWVMGTLALLGYKITLLTGVIPSIIVVIGIPNSIYLLNKYHQEFIQHGNKERAIAIVTQKIGFVTLITNATTAVGFGVLMFTSITILKEFGLVAAINIMATFIVSIILMPSVFAYLPAPSRKHLKHLKFKPLDKLLTGLDLLVHRYKYRIFFVTGVIVIISTIGLYRITAVSYMVDDLPKDSEIKKDLNFFEQNFSGIMPLEIVVDTKKRKGVQNLKNMKKIEEFENFLESQKNISKPVSIVSFVKALSQAYYSNNPRRYVLPDKNDSRFIFRYLSNSTDQSGLMESFVDSTGQKMRISLQVADIGSHKMDSLLQQVIIPEIERIFGDTEMEVSITGTTPLFIKGNSFLIENLKYSFILAFGIIAFLMAVLFANTRMIILSLIPNIIPLLITAGIMGFSGIPLKPSTAIVFSIAFGISVDFAIHFLAKYRQELFANNFFVPVAVSKAMRELGPSMIYTAIVLFAGFIIFTFSDFGGTKALGLLTSITLFISMLTNLIVLPALLLTFDDGKRKKDFHPLIEHVDEFYLEEADEEINLDKIEVEGKKTVQ